MNDNNYLIGIPASVSSQDRTAILMSVRGRDNYRHGYWFGSDDTAYFAASTIDALMVHLRRAPSAIDAVQWFVASGCDWPNARRIPAPAA